MQPPRSASAPTSSSSPFSIADGTDEPLDVLMARHQAALEQMRISVEYQRRLNQNLWQMIQTQKTHHSSRAASRQLDALRRFQNEALPEASSPTLGRLIDRLEHHIAPTNLAPTHHAIGLEAA